MNYKKLYFDDNIDFDVSKVLTTVEMKITINGDLIVWANSADDLGGDPNTIEVTPFTSPRQITKRGLEQTGLWNMSIYYNDDDADKLEEYLNSTELQTLEIQMKSGTKWTVKANCVSLKITGFSIGSALQATAAFELSDPNGWKRTKANATPTNSVG